ncbi:hypothetical protein HN51_053252 [Arachis hypogaea]
MILSFALPFALIPLLKFTSSKTKMGEHVNSLMIASVTWMIGSLIMTINIYYLISSFIKLLLHAKMKMVGKVFVGILGFSGVAVYLAGIAYLVVRKNRKATPFLALTSAAAEDCNESLSHLPREDIVSMQLPERIVSPADI